MNAEEIENAWYEANTVLHATEQQQNRELDAIREKYDRLASHEKTQVYKAYRDQLEQLRNAANKAKDAVDELKVAQAGTEGWKGHPVGTVLCQWATAGKYGRGKLVIKQKAVVEVCTKDTKFGANASQWRKPPIGTTFLRALKKDGTSAMNAARNVWGAWLPEGQKPEDAE